MLFSLQMKLPLLISCLSTCNHIYAFTHVPTTTTTTTRPHIIQSTIIRSTTSTTSTSHSMVTNDEQVNGNNDVQYYSPNNYASTQPRMEDTSTSSTSDVTTLDITSEFDENSLTSSSSPSSSVNEYSFFDEAVIYVRAGSGGQGSSTYQKSGPTNQNGSPDGGSGGNGGSVYLIADDNLNTLAGLNPGYRPNSFGGSGAALSKSGGMSYHSYRPLSYRAENGHDGERQFKSGKYGKDVFIRIPPGTMIQEEYDIYEEEGEEEDKEETNSSDDQSESEKNQNISKKNKEKVVVETRLFDLGSVGGLDPNDENAIDDRGLPCNVNQLLIAQGGDGGEGSGLQGFKKGRGVRRTRAPPVGGERKRIKLTLKIVADVALVGVPNAGKSTFLAAVTRAKPKIANYPFTTVIPNLGVWIPPKEYNDASQNGKSKTSGAGSEGLALCDVPGLIAGAADGVGLGHAFLRHVERCHVILHLVDATSSDPVADFHMINDEILRFGNGKLAQMPQIVVVNKVDAWEDGSGEEWEKGLKTRMDKVTLEESLKEAMTHSRLMWMSAKERDGVDDLMGRMAAFVKKVKSTS